MRYVHTHATVEQTDRQSGRCTDRRTGMQCTCANGGDAGSPGDSLRDTQGEGEREKGMC